jgi:hypothetical protein
MDLCYAWTTVGFLWEHNKQDFKLISTGEMMDNMERPGGGRKGVAEVT